MILIKMAKLMKERERYLMKTRMSKNERNKVTAKRLNEFAQIIESVKNDKNVKGNKRKLVAKAGIEFDDDFDAIFGAI